MSTGNEMNMRDKRSVGNDGMRVENDRMNVANEVSAENGMSVGNEANKMSGMSTTNGMSAENGMSAANEAQITDNIREKQTHKLKNEFKSDITKIVKFNKKQVKEDFISIEGQIIASFALGILCGPYTYSIIFLILFFILYELIYFAIRHVWPIKLRLSVTIAYIIGLLIGCYCAQSKYPTFF